MQDQLNAEAVEQSEVSEAQTTVESQTIEESATSTEQEQDKKPEITPEAQKIIAEKAFNEREAKREADALRKQLEELKKQNAPQAPEAIERPDRWEFDTDEEYNQAVDNYAERKAQIAAYELQQQQEVQRQQKQQYAAQQEQQKLLQEKAQTYTARAKELGVDAAELQHAGAVIANYGVRDDVTTAILEDADGPLITKYLAANPQAIDALNNSTWLNGQDVFRSVKEAASALKPKASSAPAPADILQNGATTTDNNPWGAEFS